MQENHYGKKSEVHITAGYKDSKTYLEDVYFTAPFKVMKPFYESEEMMQLMLISVSAGIMAGDTQDIQIDAEEGARLEINSQSYEKIHKMEEGCARRHTEIRIGKNAHLFYNPLPTIPFADSDFASNTSVELEDESSVLEYKEILSCGRAASGERFLYRAYRNKLTIRLKQKLIYYDNCVFQPSSMNMEGFGMFEGYSHMGTYLVYDCKKNREKLEKMKNVIAERKLNAGATRNEHGLVVVKMLGNSAQELENIMEYLWNCE